VILDTCTTKEINVTYYPGEKISAMRPAAAREEEMGKSIYRMLGPFVLIGAIFAFGATKEASAQVSVNINIGPPPIVAAEPPEMVMVPGSAVFFVPLPNIDVFFFNGYWWSPRGGLWYRSRAYNGPWGVVNKRYVPSSVYRVPGDYRRVYEKEKHIPYGQWKKERHHGREGNGGKHGRGHGH
jgi:hypothetical protein